MDQILGIISPLVPACICFGPLFIVIGILQRTPASGPVKKPWVSQACLFGGAAMVTLALLFLFIKIMPAAGH